MDNTISFSLMADHRKPMSYDLTFEQFLEFRCLIQLGGTKTIGNHHLSVDKGSLKEFKEFGTQPSYEVNLEGALGILDLAEKEARKKQ